MDITQIIGELKSFRGQHTEQAWRRDKVFAYENDYIELLRIDSSNKCGGSSITNGKQWSIIFKRKNSFTHLPNWRALLARMHGDMVITPVSRGVLAGNYVIRIYNMADNPNEQVVRDVLDFIFS